MQHDTVQKRFLIRTFLSSLAVLVLFLSLLTGYAFYSSRAASLNTLSNLNSSLTQQANDFTDQLYEMVRTYSTNVFNARAIKKLRRGQSPANGEIIDGMRELRTYASSTEYIHSIYVYNGSLDYVYTTLDSDLAKGSAPTADYFDREAVDLIRSGLDGVPVSRAFPYGGTDEYVISFLTCERNDADGGVTSAMLVNVSVRWLSNFLLSLYIMENTALYLEDGTALIASGSVPLSREDAAALISRSAADGGGNTVIHQIAGQRAVSFCVKNGAMNSYFIRTIPYRECLRQPLALRRNMTLLILGIAAIGLVVCAMLAQKLNLPAKKLLRIMPDVEAQDAPPTSLDEVVDLAADELEKYSALIREEYLRRLLLFLPSEPVGQKELDRRKLALRAEEPLSVLLLLPGEQPFPDILADDCRCEQVRVNTVDVLLLQCGEAIWERLLSQATDASLFCAFCRKTDFASLHRSYAALRELYDLRAFLPGRRAWPEDALYARGDTVYPKRMEMRIVSSLATGNAEKAQLLLPEFVAQIAETSRYAVLKAHLTQLYCTVAELDGSDTFRELDPKVFFEMELAACETENELLQLYSVLFYRIAEQTARQKKEQEVQLLLRVKVFLETNYMDPDISPLSIAEAEGVQTDELSEAFKKSEGMSLSKYLLQIRMKKATQLLCSTNLSVKEIAKMVGFSNPQYFFALFKSAYGITPNSYRESRA